MPTTYTHYRFGNDVYQALPSSRQDCINAHRGLYDIGLHGPDLLFYYKALSKNPVNQTGFLMHEKPGADFFEASRPILAQMPDQTAGLAYLYGFLCHFALDSRCHPYVEQQVRESGISHSEIEAELDRALMVLDGHDPITYRPTGHLNPIPGCDQVIAPFFPGIGRQEIMASVKSIRTYCNLLVAPSHLRRWFTFTLLKMAHSYDSIHGMIINYEPNPKCSSMCLVLQDQYQASVQTAVELIENYTQYLETGSPLDERFAHTFGED